MAKAKKKLLPKDFDALLKGGDLAALKAVFDTCELDARGGEAMLKATRQNLNKPMGVVLIEKRRETTEVDGKKVTRDVTDEEVINDATIRGIFSNNFQITGLSAGEARDLALLMRSGSLATVIYLIEERAVGPSLGRDNIEKGVTALIGGIAGGVGGQAR